MHRGERDPRDRDPRDMRDARGFPDMRPDPRDERDFREMRHPMGFGGRGDRDRGFPPGRDDGRGRLPDRERDGDRMHLRHEEGHPPRHHQDHHHAHPHPYPHAHPHPHPHHDDRRHDDESRSAAPQVAKEVFWIAPDVLRTLQKHRQKHLDIIQRVHQAKIRCHEKGRVSVMNPTMSVVAICGKKVRQLVSGNGEYLVHSPMDFMITYDEARLLTEEVLMEAEKANGTWAIMRPSTKDSKSIVRVLGTSEQQAATETFIRRRLGQLSGKAA